MSATIDGLVFDHDLVIEQRDRPADPTAPARPTRRRARQTSRRVLSYVHALAQCRGYLARPRRGDRADDVDVPGRARGRRSRASRGPRSARRWPASSSASSRWRADIEDHPDNATRFVSWGATTSPRRRATTARRSSASRTPTAPASLYGDPRSLRRARHQPDQAREPADEDAAWATTASSIEFEGHVADDVIADCLADLQAHLAERQVPRLVPGHRRGGGRGARRGHRRPRGRPPLGRRPPVPRHPPDQVVRPEVTGVPGGVTV